MVAEVVSYSRLMETDETGTLAALKDRRKSILDPTVRAHGDGMEINAPGVRELMQRIARREFVSKLSI